MLPSDYLERTYAGVLGKIVGVYLGRPFEQWSRSAIQSRLGEVEYYVNEELGQPLVVADDDITGTFTFLRALEDNDFDPNLTPEQIGETWLNYIVENRTILWWGGMSTSTEHTAYLRLKSGFKAPLSGAIETNGKTVAEQIGAQIFIDGWGLIHPGDPEAAADWARRAASVSHDGEAIHGAQVIAALVAGAFTEPSIDKLLDRAIAQIPADCRIRYVIDYTRDLVERKPDWREGFGELDDQFGYHRHGGECHIVPNHALVIFSLLHGKGHFQDSMRVVNSCGWDTDCNAGNLGCILGVRGGLQTFENGPEWLEPVADRLVLPSADGGSFASDALTQTFKIARYAHKLKGLDFQEPKEGARFHFSLPYSVQGFVADQAQRSRDVVCTSGAGALNLLFLGLGPGRPAIVTTPTFILPAQRTHGGYQLQASPSLYPGQVLRAQLEAIDPEIEIRFLLRRYGPGDEIIEELGPPVQSGPWLIPGVGSQPIFEVGFYATSKQFGNPALTIDWLTWDGVPSCEFVKPEARGEMWLRQWVNGLSELREWRGDMDCVQNEGTGLAILGCREWQNYRAEAQMHVLRSKQAGLAVHVQGLRRYYALVLEQNKVKLIKSRDGLTTLAEKDFELQEDENYRLTLETRAKGNEVTLTAFLDGEPILEAKDTTKPLTSGAIGIVVTEGRVRVGRVKLQP